MNRHEYNTGGAYIVARFGEDLSRKLTQAKALEILQRCEMRNHYMQQARALSNDRLGDKFGISGKAAQRIALGQRGHTGRPYRGITAADRALIRQCAAERARLLALAAEHSNAAIAEQYGVSANTVSCIGNGRRWVRLPLQLKPSERETDKECL